MITAVIATVTAGKTDDNFLVEIFIPKLTLDHSYAGQLSNGWILSNI